MDTIYLHVNASQGGAYLPPGAKCAREHGFSLKDRISVMVVFVPAYLFILIYEYIFSPSTK